MKKITSAFMLCAMIHTAYGYNYGEWGLVYELKCSYTSEMPLIYEIKAGSYPAKTFVCPTNDSEAPVIVDFESLDLPIVPFVLNKPGMQGTGMIQINPTGSNAADMYSFEIAMMTDNAVRCTTKTPDGNFDDIVVISNYMQGRKPGNVWDIEITISSINMAAYISKITIHAFGNDGKIEKLRDKPNYLKAASERSGSRRSVEVDQVHIDTIVAPGGVALGK
ncbi:hypothetical protein JW872_03415 [Candidatus Babeliales bacterium]|nr:hypothetical protein [Candidatus Babeliales bacterium]